MIFFLLSLLCIKALQRLTGLAITGTYWPLQPKHNRFVTPERTIEVDRHFIHEKVMEAYGYNIEQILMVDIIPDASVRRAMNEINAAQRLQLASVYKGESEKVLLVKRAEAEAEAKYLAGIGVARQRQAITDGLRENILNFSHKVEGTSAKEVMELIMVTQYFDTIKDLGNSSKNTTVFIPHGPGHVRDISDQIRNGMLEASSATVDTQ